MNLLKRRRVIQKLEKTLPNGVKKCKQNYFGQQRLKRMAVRNEDTRSDSLRLPASFLSYSSTHSSETDEMIRNENNEVSHTAKIDLVEDIMQIFKAYKLNISTLFLTINLLNRLIPLMSTIFSQEIKDLFSSYE